MRVCIFFSVAFAILLSIPATIKLYGQRDAALQVVTVDFDKKSLAGELPFDRPFTLEAKLPDAGSNPQNAPPVIASVEANIRYRSAGGFTNFASATIQAFQKYVTLTYAGGVPDANNFLLPNKYYEIQIVCRDAGNGIINLYSFTWVFYTKTKFADYLKLDFGLGYSPLPKMLIGNSCINIYLAPVNDEADIGLISDWRRRILLRTSFYSGISPFVLTSDTKQPIKNKFGLGNFVFGMGIRSPFYGWRTNGSPGSRVGIVVLQPMRIQLGGIVFAQANANPLLSKDVTKVRIYYGVSYDISFAAILGPIIKFFQP